MFNKKKKKGDPWLQTLNSEPSILLIKKKKK